MAAALLLTTTPALVGVSVRSAWAQSDEATTKAARARFQEGVEFYDKKQYEAARAAFLQAYVLRKHPSVLINLAQSSLRSNHPAEAVRYFQQFLREASNITPAQRTDAESGIKEARSKLGRIEVSAPTAAEVTVDGATVGNAPLSDAIDVEPGSHTVKVRLTDGTSDTRTINTSAGEKVPVNFTTAPPTTVPPVNTAPPPPAPATPEPAPAAAQPPTGETVTPETPKPSGTGPLKTTVPIYIGGALFVLGVADAIIFAISKADAQKSATAIEKDIRAHGGGNGTCVSTDSNVQNRFGNACRALTDNRDKIDTDALLANIGVGVAIAGGVLAVGWYFLGPRESPPANSAWVRPPIRPLVGPHTAGAALELTF